MSAWAVVKLSDVATLSSGGTPSKANAAFWDGDIPWVSPKDMKFNHLADAEDKITRIAVCESAARIVGSNSVLAVVRSGILAHTFPVATLEREVSFNQDIKAITPKNDSLIPAFLFWMLKSQEAHILRTGVKKGATVHSLSNGFLEALQFPLPPLSEQRRIVGLLDRSADIRRRADAARANARAIIPALFLSTFGDAATLLDRFRSSAMDEVISDKKLGVVRSTRKQSEEGRYGYIRMNSITSDGRVLFDNIRRTDATLQEAAINEVNYGDLLFNTRNSIELVGKMGIYRGPTGNIFNNNIMRIRLVDEILPEFLNAYMQCPEGRSAIEAIKKGTTSVCAVYYTDLGRVRVPVPPLPLQTTFAEQANRLESVASQLDAAAAKAEVMAAALSAEVFG